MLTLTSRAASAVTSVLSSSDIPAGSTLRLEHGVGPNGESGIGMAVVSEPQPGDQRVPDLDDELCVAPDVAAELDNHVLDAEVQDDGLAFSIRRRANDTDPLS